ncbi:MAG: cardiolipin synthase [Phycisphaeraceae bacterium]
MSWLFIYNIAEWITRLVMIAVILRRRFTPATSLAWLTLIFFLPIAGLVIYLLIGGHGLGRRRVRLHRKVITAIRAGRRTDEPQPHVTRPQLDPALEPVIRQAERIGGMPILGGNHVELLAKTAATIDRLVADIDAAEHHVHMVFYIFADDDAGRRVAAALVRAARRGVTCRLLADAAGSRALFGRNGLARNLREHGVETHPTLPVKPLRRRFARIDLRNHRKLAVIDGRIAYAGSQNIVNPDYGHRRAGVWHDMTGRFTGPVVAQLQIVFLEDWLYETDQNLDRPDILPPLEPVGQMPAQAVATGPSHESETLLRVILAAINAAQRKVIITSPYLIPDEPTMLVLSMAADRGVQVQIVVPRRSDHPLVSAAGRAYYAQLLDAGVSLYLHQKGLLHAKTITVDDAFALLGSSNMDIRSFYLNFELNVLMYGPQITQELRFAQTRYISEADELTADQWNRRPAAVRYLNSAAALLSPLL